MLVVYSRSSSFNDHVNAVVDSEVGFRSMLTPAVACPGNVYLVHAASFSRELPSWLPSTCRSGAVLAIADENPDIEKMLDSTKAGVHGYCNAYMAAPHYEQMIRLLENGQSWFPPPLLSEAFDLARSAIPDSVNLDKLTNREREIALAVAEGKNNRQIAEDYGISERTVKAHLTHIFKKLDIKDRVSLVVNLKQARSQVSGP